MEKLIDSFRDDYAFLSNYYYVKVAFENVIYPTVENAYQAAKTLNLDERKKFEIITPAEAKALGKEITLRPKWDLVKKTIMKDLLVQKFSIPKYKEKLLNTETANLIEGNWWHDNYWGICNCVKCKAQGPYRTSNTLGNLLMEVRSYLKPYTCHTGGADGADILFEELCSNAGFEVIAYSFEHHATKSKHQKLLTEKELYEVNSEVSKVGMLIKRTPPFKREQILSYIQRDIYQALNSQVVFAIGTINWDTNIPNGGTAWAVGMGILRNIPVYFFDQEKKSWFKYNTTSWEEIDFPDDRVFEYKDFTGIGTRGLDDSGKLAIKDIVNRYKNIKKE
jgi:ribA/ribD-fused uncharacterized protein